jgi:hypothetical protein
LQNGIAPKAVRAEQLKTPRLLLVESALASNGLDGRVCHIWQRRVTRG